MARRGRDLLTPLTAQDIPCVEASDMPMRIFQRLLLTALIASAMPHALIAQDKAPGNAQSPSTMYVVSYVEAAPASQAQVATMLRQLADASRKEGPVRFEVLQRTTESNQFVILEIWKDQQALDKHTAAAHTTQFREQVAPLLLAPIDERLCIATTVAPLREGRGAVYVVTHVDVPPGAAKRSCRSSGPSPTRAARTPGNVRFDVVHQKAKTNHFTVIGVWSDQKSDDDHQLAAHTKDFRSKITPVAGRSLRSAVVQTAVELPARLHRDGRLRGITPAWRSSMDQRADEVVDQDLMKGAVEDGPNTLGNANASNALDEGGLPSDEVAIAEDVLGANEDETQG